MLSTQQHGRRVANRCSAGSAMHDYVTHKGDEWEAKSEVEAYAYTGRVLTFHRAQKHTFSLMSFCFMSVLVMRLIATVGGAARE